MKKHVPAIYDRKFISRLTKQATLTREEKSESDEEDLESDGSDCQDKRVADADDEDEESCELRAS